MPQPSFFINGEAGMTTEEDEEEEVDLTSVRSRARLLEGGAARPGVNIFAARLNYKCIYVKYKYDQRSYKEA